MRNALTRSQRRFCTSWRHLKKKRGESFHHRRPKSKGGTNSLENISVVPKVDHDHWHAMFGNKHPREIAAIINRIWLDPRFKFVCEIVVK